MNVLVQSQRFMVFTIIDNLVANQREALKNMGDEFLRGYIGLAEGEKDPRNLLLAFAIDRVLLIEFNVSNYIEVCVGLCSSYLRERTADTRTSSTSLSATSPSRSGHRLMTRTVSPQRTSRLPYGKSIGSGQVACTSSMLQYPARVCMPHLPLGSWRSPCF